MMLGFTTDLRTHPVRYMLTRGLQATISSCVPGVFDYQGVTLDYVYAFLCWDLDLVDLKKLSINGIKYGSGMEEEEKKRLFITFDKQWTHFVTEILEKFKA